MYRDWKMWNDEKIYFSGVWCIYIMRLFACTDVFVATDVSARPWYSLLQMLFFRPMYLQDLNIFCCRCSFLDQCICNLLFFELADTFKPACHVQLHLHLAFSMLCGYSLVKMCILNLLFLCFTDTPHQNFASSTCPFYNLRMHLSELVPIHYLQKIDIRNSSEYGVSVGDT